MAARCPSDTAATVRRLAGRMQESIEGNQKKKKKKEFAILA
jgi:hypothetical protein